MRQATYGEISQALTEALEAHGYRGRLCDGQLLACPEWGIRMRLHTLALTTADGEMQEEAPIHVLAEDADAGDASPAMLLGFLNHDPYWGTPEGQRHAEHHMQTLMATHDLLNASNVKGEPSPGAARKLLQMLLRGQAQLRGVRKVMHELMETP